MFVSFLSGYLWHDTSVRSSCVSTEQSVYHGIRISYKNHRPVTKPNYHKTVIYGSVLLQLHKELLSEIETISHLAGICRIHCQGRDVSGPRYSRPAVLESSG